MVNIFIIVNFFFEYIINDIPISEIGTIITLFFIIRKSKFVVNFEFYLLVIYFIWIILSYFILKDYPYFNESSYINNSIRLLFYIIGFAIFPRFLAINGQLINIKILFYIVFILSSIGILEFIFNTMGVSLSFYIPNLSVGDNTNNIDIARFNIVRPKVIYSEVAHLSIFIGFFSTIIIELYPSKFRFKEYIMLTPIILCLFLSFSLTGYLFLILLVLFVMKKNLSGKKILWSSLFLCLIIGISILFIKEINFIIFNRILDVIDFKDGSATQRLFGAYEISYYAINYSLLTGFGIGQSIGFVTSIYLAYEFNGLMGNMNNIIAVIIAQTGFVGIVLFILFFLRIFNFRKILLLPFLLFLSGWGFFNTSIFWFVIYFIMSLSTKVDNE